MKYKLSVASNVGSLPVGTQVVSRESAINTFSRSHGTILEVELELPKAMIGQVSTVNSGSVRVNWPDMVDVRAYPDKVYVATPVRAVDAVKKTIKWHGTNLGQLRAFMGQLDAEGATDDTEFLTVGGDHLVIKVELPLATKRELPTIEKSGPGF